MPEEYLSEQQARAPGATGLGVSRRAVPGAADPSSGTRSREARTGAYLDRAGTAVKGFTLLSCGFMLLPYTRLFIRNLTVLASEFTWAERWEHGARQKLRHDAWVAWVRRQSPSVRAGVAILTGITIVTLWWSWLR